MAASSVSMPSPVAADTSSSSRSPRSADRITSRRAVSSRRSTLLPTSMILASAASASMPSSPSTRSTSRRCASVSTWLMSRTCSTRSAASTSSSVARKAATSVVGRSEMKPTVSDRMMRRPLASFTSRMVGIERGEHLVLGHHAGAGDAVEQGRLAGVGVADDGHHRIRHALAAGAMQLARAHHAGQLAADEFDALLDQPPVGLDLRLAGAAEEAEAAALAFQVGPRPHQPALLVLEMRQLHLQPALAGGRTLAEDLQDQPGAVQHLAVPRLLQVALLDGADRMIDDGEPRLLGRDQQADLVHLARAQQRRRTRPRQRHDLGRLHIEVDGLRQPDGLVEPVLRRARLRPPRRRVAFADRQAGARPDAAAQ